MLYVLPALSFAQIKTLSATKITQPIRIDGNLDDMAWQQIEPIGDFITSNPVFGIPSAHKTLVRIAYDNSAVYIGAYMYDDPANIRKQLTARDVINMQDADYFVVGFDTYNDKQNAFIFRVTAAGTQGDAKESQGGAVFDNAWDAVWESKTSIKSDGWVAEIKIPFSAIRFSKAPLQNWGLNFARFTRKDNENSIWSPVNPNLNGDVNQWGVWTGLKDIDPPLRLSFLPYLSGGIRVYPTNTSNVTEYPKSGGMDVKYGINESFTLDMTLIPDFAQVQSDNLYLNLTPFEIKFEEFRPFFTEGTELFNKSGLFYSRRVGATPGGASTVLNTFGSDTAYRIEKNPGITRLYNATKFSGRNKNKLGIGVFNAVTAPMYAVVKRVATGVDSSILTEPLTNYNIIVLDQALKHRSYITFTNTNVLRKGNQRNANVSSLDVSLYDRKNMYNLYVSGKYSSIWGDSANKNGANLIATGSKVSGKLQFNTSINLKTDNYDPNDMGYAQNNNSVLHSATVSLIYLKKTRWFLNHSYRLGYYNNYLYKPFSWSITSLTGTASFLFNNFWDLSFNSTYVPFWYNDYFVNSSVYNGYFLKRTPYVSLGISGSSDSRKKAYFSWSFTGAEGPLPHDPYFQAGLGLRYRFNDHLMASVNYNVVQDKGNWGWAFMNNPNGSPVISRRNVKTNTAVVTAQYAFTSRMNWNVRVRHYWSLLSNTNFYNLKPDGYWDEIPFMPGEDVNYNTFNVDMFYTWDFLPGSRLTVSWKNALGGNVVIDPYSNPSYFRNFGKVLDNPHSNEVTVKVVYFIDYLKLKRKK